MAKLQEMPSGLLREHPALQNMKFLYFFAIFVGHIDLLDPDPATQINVDPCGSETLGGQDSHMNDYEEWFLMYSMRNCAYFKLL
jgi:hypothetical protein